MTDRTPRELETRANKTLRRWQPATSLPNPDPQLGWNFRYIRVAMNGKDDEQNYSAKRTEGWEPVRKEDHPEIETFTNSSNSNIEIGGLVLCKTPSEFVQQRSEHYQQFTSAQSKSVEANLMKESDPRMPMFSDRKSTTTRGTGMNRS